MKHTRKVSAGVGGMVLLAGLFIGVQLDSMKRLIEPSFEQLWYSSEPVWVKTSDGKLIGVPQWQIDQMKVLQVLLVHQKGKNSKSNPVVASMVTSEQLALLQEMLQKASNLEQFRQFYGSLSDDQQKSVLANALTLEMQGLASLVMSYMFPLEIQQQMGASIFQPAGIITPVVKYLENPENQKKVLGKHTAAVECVFYRPDGNYIVSGSDDKSLIIWDAKTGKKIRVLEGHTNLVSCLAYSPDGNYIVSGSVDKSLIIWDAKTGKKIRVLEGHTNLVSCLAYSPDGNYIVSGSVDKSLIIWDAKTGEKIKLLEGHTLPINCVAYSPDGKYIVSGSADESLIIWDAKTGEEIKILKSQHKNAVSCVAYSPDGNYIVSGFEDESLVIWNSITGESIRVLKGHTEWVGSVVYSPDGNDIMSASADGFLIIWNAATGEKIKILKGSQSFVISAVYSPDGNDVVFGTEDHSVTLWKLIKPETLNYIATQLNIAQARLLYRLYLAKINNVPVIVDQQDLDYQLFTTLPADVQRVVKLFFPFNLVSVDRVEVEIEQKMNELRSSLFYTTFGSSGTYEKKRNEKIKAVQEKMQKVDKNSVTYKACERLLIQLNEEEAFEA